MNIVKVRYVFSSGQLSPREYTYFSEDPLALGDVVVVPIRDTTSEAKVTAVNIPEAEIAAFRDKVKIIPAGSIMVKPAPTLVIEPEPGSPQMRLEPAADQGPYGAQEWPPGDPAEPGPFPPGSNDGEINEEGGDFLEPTGEPAVEPFTDNGGAIEPELDPWLPAPLVTLNNEVGFPPNQILIQACQEAGHILKAARDRTIASNADLKPATDDLAIIAKGMKAVQEIRKGILAPFKAKVDIVNAAFAEIIKPLEEADWITRGKVNAWDAEQRRKSADAKRIEDEKERLAREEAKLNGTGEITVPLGTAVAPPVAEHTRTELGTLGGRVTWKARILDFKLLPDEYKLPNERLLNSLAASTKGTRQVPGVEFYTDRTATIRTK